MEGQGTVPASASHAQMSVAASTALSVRPTLLPNMISKQSSKKEAL